MRIWAWVWLGVLALAGWVPGLILACFVALAIAIGAERTGSMVFGAAYFSLLAISMLMLLQVRSHFRLDGTQKRWFTWAGGGTLISVRVGALLGFGSLTGWFK